MIKTIIFDFGGVFIDLDEESARIEFDRFGKGELSNMMLLHNERYEKGMIDTCEFLSFYKDQFPTKSEDEIIRVWNSIILDIPEHRLRFIETLRKEERFQLILLSNTNDLHIQTAKKNMGNSRYNRFKNSFHNLYLSYEIKMRKPERKIFKHILDIHGLVPNECLFIDDTKIHTNSASNVGINTWNIDIENEDITSLFVVKGSLFN